MPYIQDEKQYKAMKARVDELFFATDENTPENDVRLVELDILSSLIEEYEKEHFPIEPPTLAETMKSSLFV